MKKSLVLFVTLFLSIFVSSCSCNKNEDKKYNINFMVDGDIYSSVETSGDNVIEIPNNPVKTGYTFEGWYTDESLEVEFDKTQFENTKLTGDVSVYSKFTINQYTLSFETNCDDVMDDMIEDYNTIINLDNLNDPYLKGYWFEGWYTDQDFENKVLEITLTSDVTLYAKWEIEHYSIEYVLGQGIENNERNVNSYTINDTVTIFRPETPLLMVFKGWYEYPGGGGKKIYVIPEGSTGNITLYAYFVNEYEA